MIPVHYDVSEQDLRDETSSLLSRTNRW